MKRTIAQLHGFTRELDELIDKGKLYLKDFENFEWEIVNNPEKGDVIPD